MNNLYSDEMLMLAEEDNDPQTAFNQEIFNRAAEWVKDQGQFTPEMLKSKPVIDVINETYRILSRAVTPSSIKQEMPEALKAALKNNAFVFSGFKTYHSLSEVGLSLTNDKGEIKPFTEFQKDVEQINDKYNKNYLRAEYNHAVASSQMASKWHDFEEGGDRYNLQYRTANDEKVRLEHQALNNITLPPSDPFWERYLPPNGWNCRCTVVQVRKSKYPESDSEQAVKIGDEITTDPKKQMFRFNPGKELKLFPDKHPYNKAPGEVKKVINEINGEIDTPEKAVDFINESEARKGWFERGLKRIMRETNPRNNGSTDMNGNILLSKERFDQVLQSLNKLRKKDELTFKEEDAIATFWHEITHNMNKKGNMRRTTLQTQYMELANEFVSRSTLSEFYKSFDAKMQHDILMTDRKSTGYNRMVRNYQTLIRETGANFDGVLQDVKTHLFNEKYDNQKEGLTNALVKNGARMGGKKVTKYIAKILIHDCTLLKEDDFEAYIKTLLVEKQ